MCEDRKNYYGCLCTEMYEILHETAPQDELDFYLSYAEKGKKILEPLCGSGRFFLPFQKRGFSICGFDLSKEMLGKLKQKAPGAQVVQCDIMTYPVTKKFDYIFISSGSVSLFTDMEKCKKVLCKMKALLHQRGKFVFAVDTVACRSLKNDEDYKVSVSVKTKEGFDLFLRTKNRYEETTRTQFSPGIYELYHGKELLQREKMNFQTHLYELGEMEGLLKEAGFTSVAVYSSFQKEIAVSNQSEQFLYECTAD